MFRPNPNPLYQVQQYEVLRICTRKIDHRYSAVLLLYQRYPLYQVQQYGSTTCTWYTRVMDYIFSLLLVLYQRYDLIVYIRCNVVVHPLTHRAHRTDKTAVLQVHPGIYRRITVYSSTAVVCYIDHTLKHL